ncbi:endolytic transglycosylase MltG [Crassaminicella thermophila]|uniref:Endolytic transglycosylase MltG n=1 Tax=Crassaminicella thermophila TaxID=2599308 RepID=A0A5C0SCJ2_CRATE|nr:endolytic transglycosylase MltG [Crassaminicella thermophila]QEK12245.1 endolytic transglycosylase MltG [Crassaminicella thermophila]
MKKDVLIGILLGIGIGFVLSSGLNIIKPKTNKLAFSKEYIKSEAKKIGMIDPAEYFDKTDNSKIDSENNNIKSNNEIIINIHRGYTSEDVAKVLKQNNLISSEKEFLKKVYMKGLENSLRWGKYKFNLEDSEEMILNRIVKGDYIKD